MSPTRRELVRATRGRILEAAAQLTRERGPNGFSMDVLAKEAGVARATVYEHFRSKRAVLDDLASSTARTVTLEEQRTRNADPLIALRDMLGDVCRHWAEHEDTMRGLRTLERDHRRRATGRRGRGETTPPSRRRARGVRTAAVTLVRGRSCRRTCRSHLVPDVRTPASLLPRVRTGRSRARQARGLDGDSHSTPVPT